MRCFSRRRLRSRFPSRSRLRFAAALALVLAGTLGGAVAPVGAATPSAIYSITFDATWTALTHPVSFPPGPHFSPLVGITHNDQVVFWEVGALASDGIEQMAEEGASSPLYAEMGAAATAGNAGDPIAGGGILSPGQRVVTAFPTQEFSRLTLVSMIAPSPDWFLGVSGLELLAPGPEGDWVEELVVELHAYDAGTDSGVIYTSADADTVPAENISLITSSPFEGSVPLGTFTITRTNAPEPMPPLPALSLLGSVLLLASLVGLGLRFGPARIPRAAPRTR